MNTRVLFSSLFALALATGCESLECDVDSTVQDGNTCISTKQARCPAGASLDGNGKCIIEGMSALECGPGTHDNGNDLCVSDVRVEGNASRFLTMSLTNPDTIADLANDVLGPDLAMGSSLIFIGALKAGDQLTIWGGIDDRQNPENVLVAETAYGVAAIEGGDVFVTPPTDIPVQILGRDTILIDATMTNGVLDETTPNTTVLSFHLKGTLTPANAEKIYVELAKQTLNAVLEGSQPKDVDSDDDGTPDSWNFEANVTTTPVWVYER